MAVVFEGNKVRINLSNTESVGSSIYNYSDLQKTKKSSISSTSSYFLSTNNELSKQIIEYLNCDKSTFVVDISKVKKYIKLLDEILINYDKNDFHGELRDYYDYKDYYLSNDLNFGIGFGKVNMEDGTTGRSYLRFNNDDKHVKIFRGIIIAIFSSLIIEKRKGKNYIYPEVKKEIIGMTHDKIKNEFKRYMLEVKKLNENSVNQYLDVIDYTSKDAIDDGILDKSIYEYFDPSKVRDILDTLRQNDHFNTITFKRNHINTAAIGNYINFLEHKNSANDSIVNKNEETTGGINMHEKQLDELFTKLKSTTNHQDKAAITKEIIRTCYELLNYYN